MLTPCYEKVLVAGLFIFLTSYSFVLVFYREEKVVDAVTVLPTNCPEYMALLHTEVDKFLNGEDQTSMDGSSTHENESETESDGDRTSDCKVRNHVTSILNSNTITLLCFRL